MTNGPFDDGVLAQAWCSPENEHKEMDVVLCAELTRIANARYREMLEKQGVRVYFDDCKTMTKGPFEISTYKPRKCDTHTGILVAIEEIK